jgi:hypothetical protein
MELAGGSVIGQQHLRVGRNNQDAYFWTAVEDLAIAVVCDGCGSSAHSEVGAKLGAHMTVNTLQRLLKTEGDLEKPEIWQSLQQQLLTQLQTVAKPLGNDLAQTVQDYLLFTITGVVITPKKTAVFALGDGVIAINGQVMSLGPFANNAPPYLAYGLLKKRVPEPLQVLQILPTESLQSLLIGSDGVGDLMQVAEQSLPGRSEKVGAIAQFWQDDRYFRNPDQVRRRLSLINREVMTTNLRQSGLLPDDTTLIVIRRQNV